MKILKKLRTVSSTQNLLALMKTKCIKLVTSRFVAIIIRNKTGLQSLKRNFDISRLFLNQVISFLKYKLLIHRQNWKRGLRPTWTIGLGNSWRSWIFANQ